MVNKVIMVLYIYVLSFKSVALQEPTHVKTKNFEFPATMLQRVKFVILITFEGIEPES